MVLDSNGNQDISSSVMFIGVPLAEGDRAQRKIASGVREFSRYGWRSSFFSTLPTGLRGKLVVKSTDFAAITRPGLVRSARPGCRRPRLG
ncbi:hypothetical protein D9M68_996750 [compost metagenome]